MEPLLTLYLTARERDTLIAALRYWQRACTFDKNESPLATNGGEHTALTVEEIDELIENRINSAAE